MTSSELPPFAQATAGSLGSAVSGSIVYPLDLISTRLQTRSTGASRTSKNQQFSHASSQNGFRSLVDALREVVQKKGWGGLYQGWSSDTISSMLSNFLFFFFRSFLIERAISYKARASSSSSASASASASSSKKPATASITSSQDLAIGFLAGVASRFFTTPLSNVTVRLQTSSVSPSSTSSSTRQSDAKERKGAGKEGSDSESEDEANYDDGPGIITTLRDIVEEKGAVGLWSGFETAILLSSQPAITFFVSSLLSQALIPRASREKPTALQVFLVNALGSTASTLALYPLILSKSRLMWRSPSGRRQYRNLLDVIRKTVRRSGIKGLYQGWESQITKGLFNHGLTMLVKSRVEGLFVMLYLLLRNRAGTPKGVSGGAALAPR